MKNLSIVMIVLALAAIAPVLGEDSVSRPPGVAEKEWVSISDTLGLVVVGQRSSSDAPIASDRQALIVAQPVNGYFMVKRGGRWQRLVVLEPFRG